MDYYRVTAPHYVAGFDVKDNIVVHGAPLLHWAIGQRATKVIRYLCRKNYIVEHLSRDGKPFPKPRNVCMEPIDVQVPELQSKGSSTGH